MNNTMPGRDLVANYQQCKCASQQPVVALPGSSGGGGTSATEKRSILKTRFGLVGSQLTRHKHHQIRIK